MIVYTATDGRKLAPNRAWPGVRMICFSEPEPPPPWEWMPLTRTSLNPTRNAKAPRVLPWYWLPEWDRCLWIDATMELIRDPREMTGEFAAFRHHVRDCIYAEADECIKLGKDNPDTIRHQMRRYAGHHPRHWGLWATGVILRVNTERNRKICVDWWREIGEGSRRDQLSLPVVARRHSLVIDEMEGRYDKNQWTVYHRRLNRVAA